MSYISIYYSTCKDHVKDVCYMIDTYDAYYTMRYTCI